MGKTTRRTGSNARLHFSRLHVSLALFTFLSLASAEPTLGATKLGAVKFASIGLFATGSLGTGLTALQLDSFAEDGDPNTNTNMKFHKMVLRVAPSTCLGFLAVTYTLCFLSYPRKTKNFVFGFSGISAVSWLVGRLIRSGSPATGETADAFSWLDNVNLFGLLAVMVGILNAERGLVSSVFSARHRIGDSDGAGRGVDGHLADGDEESQVRNRRSFDAHRGLDTGDVGLSALSLVGQLGST